MMPQTSEIISLTRINADLFTNDEGEFPTFITLIVSSDPTEVVQIILGRMQELFAEYTAENEVFLRVDYQIAGILRDREDNTHTIITPNTLAMILEYAAMQRLVVLELAFSPNALTIH